MEIKEYEASVKKSLESTDRKTIPFPKMGIEHIHNKIVAQMDFSIKANQLRDELRSVSEDGHTPSREEIESLKAKLGDVLWYLTTLSLMHGLSLEDVVESNLNKLRGNNE